MEIDIAGGSMSPTLKQGETVSIRHGLPCVGEIVAFQSGGTIIVHRVIDTFRAKGKRYYLHRGDASKTCGVFADHELMGVVEGHQARKIRWLTRIRARIALLFKKR